MKPTRLVLIVLAFSLLFSSFSCKGEPDVFTNIGPDPMDEWFDKDLPVSSTNPVFSRLPIEEGNLHKVYPLGMMGSHIFPTDHIYLAQKGATPVPVYAPAAGIIHYIETPDQSFSQYNDYSIRVAISRDFTYVLGHIMADDSLTIGKQIKAGDLLGTTVIGSSLDLLVLDRARGNSLDNDKYPMTMHYAQNPFQYFEVEKRDSLYSFCIPPVPSKQSEELTAESEHATSLNAEHTDVYLEHLNSLPDGDYQPSVNRGQYFADHYRGLRSTYNTFDGDFEYDIANSLQGNWFAANQQTGHWDEGIAFVYDPWYPSQIRISSDYGIDGIQNARYAVHASLQSGFLPFSEVTAGDTALYALFNIDETNWHGFPWGAAKGILKVHMQSSTAIIVEFFRDTSTLNPSFTSAARYYYR